METIRRAFVRPLDSRAAYLGLAVLMLNLLDAFATLRHLEHGATELNPFMKVLLSRGAADFLIVKHVLASLGVMGIVLHPGRRAAIIALFVLVPLYSLLALYQLALFYVM
jgi:hypothetical protein